MSEREEIEELITKYAEVRNDFEDLKNKHPKYLAGNDNYIGIIGEYWARIFLKTLEENENSKINNSSAEGNKSEKWVDFKIINNKITEYINVKTIFEDKNETSGYIKHHKTSEGILSIIIIKLDNKLFPKELLYIKDIDTNLKNGTKRTKKYKERWEAGKEINFRYYKNYNINGNNINGFDCTFKDCIWEYENEEFELKYNEENTCKKTKSP
jgi:hypothetical protein